MSSDKLFFTGFSKFLEPVIPSNIKREAIPTVQYARVIDIIIDRNHPKYTSDAVLGMIQYRILNNEEYTTYNDRAPERWAIPLNRNIRCLPVRGEIVPLYLGPSPWCYILPTILFSFYDSPVSIFSSTNYNPVPVHTPASGNKSASLAIPSPGQDFSNQENFGLLPFNGDLMIESRFGSSFRMSSTQILSENPNWSSRGTNGNPITILVTSIPSSQSRVEHPNIGAGLWQGTNHKIPLVISAMLNNTPLLKSWVADLSAGSTDPTYFSGQVEREKIVEDGGDSST